VFDLRDRSTKFLADVSNESVMGLYFRDSRLLIASGYDVRFLHDLTDQRAPVPLVHSPAPIGCICVTPDERVLFTGDVSPPFHIRAWDFHTGQSLGLLQGHTAAVCELRCSSSDVLASAGIDGTVRFWDVDSRTQTRILKGHHAAVRSISFSNDNRVLASAGSDRQVRFWDPVTGIASPLVLNHAAPVLAVAFCPDESLLATGDDDGNIRLWTLPNGEELLVLARLRNKVHSLAFSPDASALVASATYDESRQEIRIWTAPPIGAHETIEKATRFLNATTPPLAPNSVSKSHSSALYPEAEFRR
jgi:WD40 repeat protein